MHGSLWVQLQAAYWGLRKDDIERCFTIHVRSADWGDDGYNRLSNFIAFWFAANGLGLWLFGSALGVRFINLNFKFRVLDTKNEIWALDALLIWDFKKLMLCVFYLSHNDPLMQPLGNKPELPALHNHESASKWCQILLQQKSRVHITGTALSPLKYSHVSYTQWTSQYLWPAYLNEGSR